MTHDEITRFMRRLYGECGQIWPRDSADGHAHEAPYEIVGGDQRDDRDDLICVNRLGHTSPHTFVTLQTDQCIWGPRDVMERGAPAIARKPRTTRKLWTTRAARYTITSRRRAQIVELLRCAADVDSIAVAFWYLTGVNVDDVNDRHHLVWDLAVQARIGITNDDYRAWVEYRLSCLEAAKRVEDGEWP
jgi:hypothetical protein